MSAAQALLFHCVDFAGMFPPASLSLSSTLAEYSRYRSGETAWALGRLVLPAGSLAGFRASAFEKDSCPISVVLGQAWANDVRLASQMGIELDVVEFRPSRVEEIRDLRTALPRSTIYFEVSPDATLSEFLAAVADAGACAKIRTGGIHADAIPSSAQVLRFLSECIDRQLPFKATAGLHHAIHAFHTLTYAVDSDRALMHGFINVILAAALLLAGGDRSEALELLEDSSTENFAFEDQCVRWLRHTFTTGDLEHARTTSFRSFGSCSFREPVSELKQMRSL